MRTHLLFLASAGMLAACDIPSSAPIFQQTWVVPGDSVSVGVTQFLPANISLAPGGSAFAVTGIAPATFSSTLGALCSLPACQSGGTVNAPVPAFSSAPGALFGTVAFPAGVDGVSLSGGSLQLAVTNSLGFDPLRPNGAGTAPFGTLTVTIYEDNLANGTVFTFNGATQALPNGATTILSITLPTLNYAGILADLELTVPAGGTASLSASNAISITATAQAIQATAAFISMNNEPINVTPTAYDLSDVDFADDVQGGGMTFEVDNPIGAAAAMTVVLAAPAQNGSGPVSISRPLTIPNTPTSSASITLDAAELRSLIGKNGVTLAVSGTANGTSLLVTPASRITLRTLLNLIVNVGG